MAELLWKPSSGRIQQANLTSFIEFVNQKHGTGFTDYAGLYDWSIADIPAFQEAVWQFYQPIHSQGYDQVAAGLDKMPGAKWFPGAKLNFAENLLRYRDGREALVFRSEPGDTRRMTYAELYEQTARVARTLKELGVQPGDRVVGFMPNIPETVVAMLAATSLGATWSSCSPDFGFQGVMDRFGQIQPKVLFAANGYFYNGKAFDSLGPVAKVKREIASLEKVIVVPFTEESPDIAKVPGAISWTEALGDGDTPEMEFAQLPFDHPLYILYSSGTTGVPKCMVHGAAATSLMQHYKEHGPANRPQARGPHILLHHLRLDDVELAGILPFPGRHRALVRRLALLSRSRRAMAIRPGRGHDHVRHQRPLSWRPLRTRA
jgi:acetoacetyl-CoA synthetase